MSDSRLTRFWGVMAQTYGAQWHREYGDEPNYAWAQAIAHLSDEQIRYGLELLRKQDREFPPNCGQFVNMAKSYRDIGRELPAPSVDWATGKMNFKLLKILVEHKGLHPNLAPLVEEKNRLADQLRSATSEEFAEVADSMGQQLKVLADQLAKDHATT